MTITLVGPQDVLQLAGAIALGDVELDAGAEYALEAPLDVPSGRALFCRGPRAAVLRSTWYWPEPVPDGPPPWDDPANAILRVRGVLAPGAGASSTTAVASKDSLALVVDDAAWITAGAWLRVVSGGGGPDDQVHQTDSLLIEFVDLVQVDSSYQGGLVVPLRRPVAMHHRAGASVVGWLPARDVRIDGVELVAGGAAVGILCADGVGMDLRNVRGSGFSRALINVRAVRGLQLQAVRGLSANNALVFLESCAVGRVNDVSNDEDGERFAPTGIPRGLVTIRGRTTGIDLGDIHLAHGCVGLQLWGGQGVRFGAVSARDMCPDMARQRDHEINPNPDHEYGGGNVGAALDMGTNVTAPPSASEFGYGVTIASLYAENCHGAHNLDVAVYGHDVLDLSIGSCVISNKGLSPYVPGAPKRRGAVFSDAQGHVGSLRCTGVDEPLRVRGYWTPSIGHFCMEGAAGWSGPPNISCGPSVIFDSARMGAIGLLENRNGRNVAFGDQFQGTPDFELEIGIYRLEWFEARGVTLADGGSTVFNVGDIAAIDPASPPGRRHIIPSSEDATACVVVVSGGPWDVATGLHLVCPLPSARVMAKCTVDAVPAGAQLVASATPGRARARQAGDSGVVIGVATLGKTAGDEGLVPIGPA